MKIVITSLIDGFRRCGVAHPKSATEYPPTKFKEEEIKILLQEPNLVVELLDDDGEVITRSADHQVKQEQPAGLLASGPSSEELEGLRQELDRLVRSLDQVRGEYQALQREKDQLSADLAAVKDANQRNADDLARALEKESELQFDLDERDKVIASRDQVIAERDTTIADLQEKLKQAGEKGRDKEKK